MNNINISQKFVDFINTLVDRPAMFQINNVEDLSLVIFGYQAGCNTCADDGGILNQMIVSFREFINKEFSTKEDYDWARVIRFNSEGDKGSIELFKLLFNKFANSSNVSK